MPKSYWLLERENPQLGTYYVKLGQLYKKEARLKEDTLYGSNTVIEFKTEEEYLDKIHELTKDGYHIH